MPYKTLEQLTDSVRDHLPSEAQTIYKEAFNHAWVDYADPNDRKGDASREEVAHKVAWSAVKNVRHKQSGEWVKRQ